MRVPGLALARRPGWPAIPAGPASRLAPARPVAAVPALADAAGAELHADPGAGGPRGLGDGMFPGALAAAAHHQQVAMAEVVAERGTAAAWPQQQRPRGAERHNGHDRVLRPAAARRVS